MIAPGGDPEASDTRRAIASGDLVARRFNHDLLLEAADQERARRRWPAIHDLLINRPLIEHFAPHERAAARFKLALQLVGSAAVLLMLLALLGSAAHLWLESTSAPRAAALPAHALFEASALVGLVFALFASRWGPLRRRWLIHRFLTEVLRQWHFRRLLDTRAPGPASISASVLERRDRDLASFLDSIRGSVGQKMDRLIDDATDPLGAIPAPVVPADPVARSQLVEAYGELRLLHQLDFAVYKLSVDDRTFLGVSGRGLVVVTDQLAAVTLLLALGCSIAQMIRPEGVLSFAAVALAISGVAIRSWRDGLSLGEERERYHELRHRMDLLHARWEAAADDGSRFALAGEVEQAGVEELRSFLRAHERAQFVL